MYKFKKNVRPNTRKINKEEVKAPTIKKTKSEKKEFQLPKVSKQVKEWVFVTSGLAIMAATSYASFDLVYTDYKQKNTPEAKIKREFGKNSLLTEDYDFSEYTEEQRDVATSLKVSMKASSNNFLRYTLDENPNIEDDLARGYSPIRWATNSYLRGEIGNTFYKKLIKAVNTIQYINDIKMIPDNLKEVLGFTALYNIDNALEIIDDRINPKNKDVRKFPTLNDEEKQDVLSRLYQRTMFEIAQNSKV